MTFTVDLDGLGGLLTDFDGLASKEQITEAVTHGMRETMKQYQSRLNSMTRHWKNENKPYFDSELGSITDVNFRPRLSSLESAPMNFFLLNSRIWGIVSAGSGRHPIEGRKGALHFTGYTVDQERIRSPEGRRVERNRLRSAFNVRRRNAEGQITHLSRSGRSTITRARNTRVAGQFNTASRGQRSNTFFPPTYVAATRPDSIQSGRSQHLGDYDRTRSRNIVIKPRDGKPVVDHPGFEGRDLSGKLIEGRGFAGDNLDDFFGDQVYLKLNQLTGLEGGAGSLEGIRLRNPQGRKLVGEGRKIVDAATKYVKSI